MFSIAQIADFGLAVTGGNLDKGNLKISGTLGYVAPEYLLDGAASFCSKILLLFVDKA
jgi:serine/threonine protein kinase